MTQENEGSPKLVKLDDFEGELEEPWQDIQGQKVFDKNGEEVGTIEDLYIFENIEAVHMLKVTDDERSYLIPVDALNIVDEEGARFEQVKDMAMKSPEFELEDVPDVETRRAIQNYYGYPDTFAFEPE